MVTPRLKAHLNSAFPECFGWNHEAIPSSQKRAVDDDARIIFCVAARERNKPDSRANDLNCASPIGKKCDITLTNVEDALQHIIKHNQKIVKSSAKS